MYQQPTYQSVMTPKKSNTAFFKTFMKYVAVFKTYFLKVTNADMFYFTF